MNINRYNEFSIIIPTLNEEKGAVILIKKIIKLYKNMKIIVVDDGSIDNTASNIKKLSQKYKQILFINRAKFNIKKGLTGSIIHGILVSNTKYVIVIDADLQHPFQKIKNIIELLNNSNDDNDLVVGVRANVINWKLHRKIISRILMSIGSFILIITNKERCNDIFSGFFGIKRKLFLKIYKSNKKRFVDYGFKVLFDFLKCINKGNIKIAEVPYTFENRKYNKSKAGAKQFIYLIKSFIT